MCGLTEVMHKEKEECKVLGKQVLNADGSQGYTLATKVIPLLHQGNLEETFYTSPKGSMHCIHHSDGGQIELTEKSKYSHYGGGGSSHK